MIWILSNLSKEPAKWSVPCLLSASRRWLLSSTLCICWLWFAHDKDWPRVCRTTSYCWCHQPGLNWMASEAAAKQLGFGTTCSWLPAPCLLGNFSCKWNDQSILPFQFSMMNITCLVMLSNMQFRCFFMEHYCCGNPVSLWWLFFDANLNHVALSFGLQFKAKWFFQNMI